MKFTPYLFILAPNKELNTSKNFPGTPINLG
jgi:hypothetical protein